VLLGEPQEFEPTVRVLDRCCDGSSRLGCGYEGLCRTMYDKRDDEWDWGLRFKIKSVRVVQEKLDSILDSVVQLGLL